MRFVHHRLLVGKMQFIAEYWCPHSDQINTIWTTHDHFLQCIYLRKTKDDRIINLKTSLDWVHTPPPLRDNKILSRIYTFYDTDLQKNINERNDRAYHREMIWTRKGRSREKWSIQKHRNEDLYQDITNVIWITRYHYVRSTLRY